MKEKNHLSYLIILIVILNLSELLSSPIHLSNYYNISASTGYNIVYIASFNESNSRLLERYFQFKFLEPLLTG